MKNNYEILKCEIVSIDKGVYKNLPSFKCKITYKNEIIFFYSSPMVQKKDTFIGKLFLVAYSPTLNIGELLITPLEYEKYNIKFPDSLSWVLQYQY